MNVGDKVIDKTGVTGTVVETRSIKGWPYDQRVFVRRDDRPSWREPLDYHHSELRIASEQP